MLILTRRRYEEIVIDHNIIVKILKIYDDKVRIGIEAPTHVSVIRKEIYAKYATYTKETSK